MATFQVALQKTSSIKMFDPPRQALRALVGAAARPMFQQQARPPDISMPRAGESFTHLKLTAEKMLQEQASVKSDLEMSNAKLLKAEEQVRYLEAKLQEACNENAMLRVKHKEDTKLWTSLESKMSSTTAFFDQIAETLHCLENQVQQAESTKRLLEERLRRRDEEIENELGKYAKQLAEATRQQDEMLARISQDAEKRIQELATENESLLEKVAALEKEHLETKNSFAEELRAKQEEFEKRIRELVLENAQVQTEFDNRVDQLIQESTKAQAELEKRIADMSQEKLQVDSDSRSLLTELNREKAQAEARKEEFQWSLSQQKTQAQAEKEELEKLLHQEKTQAQAKQEELEKRLAELFQEKLQTESEFQMRFAEAAQEKAQAMVEMKLHYEKLLKEAQERELAEEHGFKEQMELTKAKYEELLENAGQKASALEKAALESRKQVGLQLEAKQAEVARHLKELSQQNDHAMTEMKRHYEKETREALQRKLADDEDLKQQLDSVRTKYEQLLQSAAHKASALEKANLEMEKRLELQLESRQAEVTRHKKSAVNEAEPPAKEVTRNKKANKKSVVSEAGPPVEEVEDVPRNKKASKGEEKKAGNKTERKAPVKRKRSQENNRASSPLPPAPKQDRRRKAAARPARQSISSGENDLFGDCLDPYRDDPYAFG